MRAVSRFGHSPARLRFWMHWVRRALRKPGVRTPFFLFSVEPVVEALARLETFAADLPIPVCHWLSFKTQPFPPLVRWWRRQGRPVEVVSEFEYRAARAEGVPTSRLLVNGPAKQRWLPHHAVPGLRVNFDSPGELAALLPLARAQGWKVGVRLQTGVERDPDAPAWTTQFGFAATEAVEALRRLVRAGLTLETVHFHLRTNVPTAAWYEGAMREVAEICREARVWPRHLDCGGGLPPPHVLDLKGRRLDAGFSLTSLARVFQRALPAFPGLAELWLENGRYLTAGSGVLVVSVIDAKRRGTQRVLIADGGRTTQALVALWEEHELLVEPPRRGGRVWTTVCGPTCMAFDRLARRPLPAGVRPGDALIWLEAGAYHLPWETRFSHGLAMALWQEGSRLSVARPAERFTDWWPAVPHSSQPSHRR